MGNLEWDLEKCMELGSGNGTTLSVGAVRREPGGRVPLLGTPKDMLSKALEMGACCHRVPVVENNGGRSFPMAFDRRVKFLFIRTVMRNSRDM
jgi:hypothetical protein